MVVAMPRRRLRGRPVRLARRLRGVPVVRAAAEVRAGTVVEVVGTVVRHRDLQALPLHGNAVLLKVARLAPRHHGRAEGSSRWVVSKVTVVATAVDMAGTVTGMVAAISKAATDTHLLPRRRALRVMMCRLLRHRLLQAMAAMCLLPRLHRRNRMLQSLGETITSTDLSCCIGDPLLHDNDDCKYANTKTRRRDICEERSAQRIRDGSTGRSFRLTGSF